MTSAAARPHPKPLRLYFLIGLMQALWTANFLIGKIALREFPAPLAAGLRVFIAAGCILPFYFWKVHGRGHWTRHDVPLLALLGFIGVAINQFFFIMGLGRTSVPHSALIIGMTPISVLLIAALRGLERITLQKLAGMLAAFCGVAILSLERRMGPGPTVTGDVFTLLAGSAFALYTVLGKEVTHRYGPLIVNTFVFCSGALFLLPVTLWQGWSFPFAQVSVVGWLSLIYMGVFPSLVCYLIFYYALGYVAASRLSTLAYLQPLAATLFSVLLLGDRITTPLALGGAIIFAGVYVTERG
ncbi:MAG: EamA family transporter [Acidobacteria bacterium]|nr:EamA family transporter [Acidobacteriota bacterium]